MEYFHVRANREAESNPGFQSAVHPRPKSVLVVVNPAPSRKIPLLAILNHAFRSAGIHWDISITHGDGDGRAHALHAIEAGFDVVAVYGGDGTVMEVASAMVGSDVPLLILGGGTGNLVASELRLPLQLEKACDLICRDAFSSRLIDVGMMEDRPFLLRAGCGIETGVVQEATRELKDQFGKWAYVFAAVKTLQDSPLAEYEITIDGQETISEKGAACVVANAGTVGLGRLTLAPSVDVDDGKLDVFFLKRASIEGIAQLAAKMMGLDKIRFTDKEPKVDVSQLINHWSVETATIATKPELDMQVDGDVVAKTPQNFSVNPGALRVVV